MDWGTGLRWRKAMVVSLILHIVILTGGGYLAHKFMMSAPTQETLIELELVSDQASPSLAAIQAATPASSDTVPQPAQLMPVTQPVTAEAAVVDASAMAVVAVDNGATVSDSATGSSIGKSTNGVSGSGSGSTESTGTAREIIPPGILSRREPNYPEKARQAGVEGTVVLRIEIQENGRPGQVSIYQSSGSELLDDAAAAAVQRWRFVPAKVRGTGQSIACQTTLPVVFKLKA